MFVLSAADLRAALPMTEAIAAMKRAFAALSDGRAEVSLRTRLRVPGDNGESLFMPAFVADPAYEALTVKTVSVFPRNAEQRLPTLHAAVMVLDPRIGRPAALLEGGTLTAICTIVASTATTNRLARHDAAIRLFEHGIGLAGSLNPRPRWSW
jgi:ornithine cyclodeaminase/alanine dehydrogenase-like protein (mu-crystallin family)